MGALLDKHPGNVGQAYNIFFLILQGLCVVGAIACIRPRAKPYENSTLDFQFYDSAHEIGCQDSSTEKLAMPASGTVCIDYRNLQKIGLPKCKTEQRSFQNMKATGIVRRIDDLGRVVIPKEIRRTMRIREGDPLEIYTDTRRARSFSRSIPRWASCPSSPRRSATRCTRPPAALPPCATATPSSPWPAAASRELLDRRISRELEAAHEHARPVRGRQLHAAGRRHRRALRRRRRRAHPLRGRCARAASLFVGRHGDEPCRRDGVQARAGRRRAFSASRWRAEGAVQKRVRVCTRPDAFSILHKKTSGRPRRPSAADAAVMDTRPVRCRRAPRSLWRDEICHAAENKKGR